jgi:hypothetical protein
VAQQRQTFMYSYESQLGLKLLDCSHLKNSKQKNLESKIKFAALYPALPLARPQI